MCLKLNTIDKILKIIREVFHNMESLPLEYYNMIIYIDDDIIIKEYAAAEL